MSARADKLWENIAIVSREFAHPVETAIHRNGTPGVHRLSNDHVGLQIAPQETGQEKNNSERSIL